MSNSINRGGRRAFAVSALALASSLAFAAPASADRWPTRGHTHSQAPRIFEFDVAEDHKQFVFDQNGPLLENGLPAAGNAFITGGFIYPKGFLDHSDGAAPDGGPSDPDKVIGRWICRGYFIGEGAATESGAWVATHQYYEFGKRAGRRSFTTDGLELADINVPIRRGITGGTGPFRKASGQVVQKMIGFQPTEAVKLRFRAIIQRTNR